MPAFGCSRIEQERYDDPGIFGGKSNAGGFLEHDWNLGTERAPALPVRR